MDDPAERDSDELATELSRRQVADWRELRFEPFTSPTVRKTLARLASQIRDAVQRSAGNRAPVVPVGPPVPARATSGTSGSHVGDPRPAAPATLVVDPYGRGDHTTIAAAVAAAGPGHLVLIRPGIYLENLVIDKPLELVGDGPLEQIVLQAAGQIAILFQASMGRLANLTIRQLGGRDSWGLEIANGRLEVEGCDISSKGRSALSVYGAADPLVRRNVIHDSRQHGILVVARGHSSFEDNEILRSGFAGIAVSGGGDPTVRRNRISDGRQGGVLVAEGGIGTFEDNEISGNRFSGVETRQGGGPLFRRNRITANLSLGVFIHSGGGGVFEENDLTGNGGGAFQVDGDCLPNVIRRDNLE